MILNNVGILARKLYDQLRCEAAAVKIEKNFRGYVARKAYLTVRSTAIALQTGLRAMKARNEFRFKKQTKAAILIQVSLSIIFMIYGVSVEKMRLGNFFNCLAIFIFCDNFFRLNCGSTLHFLTIKDCKRLLLLHSVVGGEELLGGNSESLKWSE